MAKDSRIEWTHHTFNPWWGCKKVSPACTHCYAESWARRLALDLWGAEATRRTFGEDYWRQPYKWNREAQRSGQRRRVFCASMADVFERRSDLYEWRAKLWPLIEETQCLDWLLLTKRPQNVLSMTPWTSNWPQNVWLGTTAENQKYADLRIPRLVEIPARVRFISAEPLLGSLSLEKWLPGSRARKNDDAIDWVIAGGESGHRSRPTDPAWVRSLRDECRNCGVPFHFKQWGHWTPTAPPDSIHRKAVRIESVPGSSALLYAVGKTAAGRVLDGRTWDELPLQS